jgi:glycosyltransferase involved in cell wall biosynthesis
MKPRVPDSLLVHAGEHKQEAKRSSHKAHVDNSQARSKVLIASSTLHVGGAEQIIANLAEHLDPSRYRVSVSYLKENGTVGEDIARHGIEVLPLPGRQAGRRDRFTALKLRKLLVELDIDLIHTHDFHGFLDASICKVLMPHLRHVHTFHFGNYPHVQRRFRYIEKLLWRLPDALVAVGKAQATTIRKLYGIPDSRLRILWNGVEAPTPHIFDAVSDVIGNRDEPVIASVSTLTPQKGLEDLIDAAAELVSLGTPFQLLIIGDGPLRETLEQRSSALKLNDRVHFLGWVPNASARAIPACDLLVQSSLWEAMSVLVLEAMACCKPVVVTDVGDNSQVVLNRQTGLTVPAKNPHQLALALQELLTDPALRASFGRAGHARYTQYFTTKHMVQRYEELYAELLDKRRRQ